MWFSVVWIVRLSTSTYVITVVKICCGWASWVLNILTTVIWHISLSIIKSTDNTKPDSRCQLITAEILWRFGTFIHHGVNHYRMTHHTMHRKHHTLHQKNWASQTSAMQYLIRDNEDEIVLWNVKSVNPLSRTCYVDRSISSEIKGRIMY